MKDAPKSGIGVFFFQFPSFLLYMTEMQNKRKKSNAQSMLGMKTYQVLDEGVLVAIDGVRYHSWEKIQSADCLRKTKEGVTTYYHSALAAPHLELLLCHFAPRRRTLKKFLPY